MYHKHVATEVAKICLNFYFCFYEIVCVFFYFPLHMKPFEMPAEFSYQVGPKFG